MASSLLGKIKKGPSKEGWLDKAKAAKGDKDECRGGWQPRYFLLQGHELYYFKKENEKDRPQKAKGVIDMRNAKVDAVPADQAMGKANCFKVNSHYTFYYMVAPNADDAAWWLYRLRKAAKYDDPQSLYYTKLYKPGEKPPEEKVAPKAKAEAKDKGADEAKSGGAGPEAGMAALKIDKDQKDKPHVGDSPPTPFAAEDQGEDSFLVSWGAGPFGQLGNNSTDISLAPVLVGGGIEKLRVRQISAGRGHVACVTDKGVVYTWGLGEQNQLGTGRQENVKTPRILARLVRDACLMVACGGNFTLALTRTGAVYSWGEGSSGQLGHGDTESQALPQLIKKIDGTSAKCRYIAAGANHAAAIVNEHLCCWGSNSSGQLGLNVESRTTPGAITELSDAKDPYKQIDCGSEFTAALKQSGALYTCGLNSHGQLGYAGPQKQPKFQQVMQASSLGKCMMVACGATHMTAAIQGKDGKQQAITWGTPDAKAAPPQGAAILQGATYAAGSATHYHVLLTGDDGQKILWSAGSNDFGQLGTGTVDVPKTYAKSILTGDRAILQVVCGLAFTVVLMRGNPPAKVYRGEINEFLTPEQKAARQQEEEQKKLDEAKRKQDEERRKREEEEAEKKRVIEEAERKKKEEARIKEKYGGFNPCAKPGEAKCPSLRAPGSQYCPRHTADLDAPVDPEALPYNWTKAVDPKTNRTFYTHKVTKKTQFRKPSF